MRRWIAPLLALALVSCGYMTKSRFDELWDKDGDSWGVDEDCNDNDAKIHPWAADVRGDGCDADCGMEPDADGDDWPDDSDCEPANPNIFPCNPDEVDGDGIDSDCDGNDGIRTQRCNTSLVFDFKFGFDPDFPPAVGATESQAQEPFLPSCLDDGNDDDDDDDDD
ncbi:MAG: hypothetical protein AB8H79_19010 [Myxococcota bacterium]